MPWRKIAAAVAGFHADGANEMKPLMRKLYHEGQHPLALIIACSDSRVLLPDQLEDVPPGEIFVLRNVGNLVPAQKTEWTRAEDSSVGAAVDYAIAALGIRDIIVMGHSDCGAMKAAFGIDLPYANLNAWLAHAQPAVSRMEEAREMDVAGTRHDQLAQLNVLVQLDNLLTYDSVKEAVEKGELRLHGWYFDIPNAETRAYNPNTKRFERINADSAVRPLVGEMPPAG